MADENVTIGIKTTADNAGAKEVVKQFNDISKETVSASKHATQLLYIINELTKQLDGMDSESAKVLRGELAKLSETINSLDIDRLKHLDSILASMAKSGTDLAGEGFADVAENIAKLNDEAKAFQATFSNANNVTVDVDVEGLDDLDALRNRMEGMEAANKLVTTLKAVKAEADALGINAIPGLSDKIGEMVNLASNAGPESVEKLRNAYAALAQEIEKLGETQKSSLKFFKFDTIASQLDNLQSKVGTVADRSKSSGDMINAASSILQGNLGGIGDMLKSLITRTQAWSKAMSGVSAAKAGAALGVFVAGMMSLVNLAKQWLEYWQSSTREMNKQRAISIGQESENIKNNISYADKVAERNMRRREIEVGSARARRDNEYDMRVAAIELQRKQELAANPQYNAVGRAEVNREADRKIEDLRMEQARTAVGDAEDDRVAKLEQAMKKQDRLKAAIIKLNQKSAEITALGNEAEEPGLIKEYLMNLGDSLGADFKGEYVDKIKDAADVQQAISKMVSDIDQQMKDHANTIADLEAQGERNKEAMEKLDRQAKDVRAARAGEDAQVDYEIDNTQMARAREVAERRREQDEADAQAELDYQATMQSMQEKRAALIERRAKREAELKDKEAQLRAFAGMDEADLSDRQKQERQWLEQDVDRLRGQVRGDTASIRSLDRQGDTERYAREREYYAEQRDQQEADRQMLRQWQNSRLGLGGRTADAKNELDRQNSLLAQEQDRMKTFIAGVEKRTGRKFRYEDMTEEEKARFNDNRSDIRMRKEGVRTAQGEYFNALREGEQKDVEFRNGLKESNRLTALGLAGGGEFQWGKDTAKNTAEMVALLEGINAAIKGGGGGGATSAQYGY